MRDEKSICLEIPVPWSEKPMIVRAQGALAILVVGILALMLMVFGWP